MQQVIPVDAITDAAVLAEPVCDAHGQVLLPIGTKLTKPIVSSLRRRGVMTVLIDGPEPEPESESAPVMDMQTRQARIDSRMKRLFRHALRTGHVNPLLHFVSRYRAENPL